MSASSDSPAYRHLGVFSDLVRAAQDMQPLFPALPPNPEMRGQFRNLLRFSAGEGHASDVRVERRWSADGIDGEELSWSVGYGPRTQAWLLKPHGVTGRLPGIVALHDHGHFKFYGKEKIADGPDGVAPGLSGFRAEYYGGRAFANLLAKAGYAVLIHDVFLWGSRRIPLSAMPHADQELAGPVSGFLNQADAEPQVRTYNGAAYINENLMAKYCTVLGTSIAAIVAFEDRCGLDYLHSRPDVDPARMGCVGLSGGGARAALLRATSDDVTACVIAGMMCAQADMLSDCIAPHTWMFFPPGLTTLGDWPDLPATAAPSPLLVQYLRDDAQFTMTGMQAADARISDHYAVAGAKSRYSGVFYPGPHRFDEFMQKDAFHWLKGALQAA